MKYLPIDNSLFVSNRQNFAAQLKSKSIAFFNANDQMPRSGDGTFLFRQNADLFYLSGIDQEQTILMIFPDSPVPHYREALFLRKTSDLIKVWEGHKYTKEDAREASGIQNVYWMEDFDNFMYSVINQAENIYINLNEHDRYGSEVPYRELRFFNSLKTKYPLHNYERTAPIMSALRSVKTKVEIELIKKAVDITGKAFERVLRFVRPGVMEYEIEAEIIHEFIRNRANGHAYDPIIASGENANILHYVDNNRECKDGDLLLMDFGAEYANYAADLTRTIPVNGKYTERQRNVYDAVLRVMKQAKKMLVSGNTIEKYHKEVGKVMEEELIGLGLLNKEEVKKQDPEKPLYKKYFMHGTSHFLGLDVHDVGNRYKPMAEGMVFTCEPGIYIPEENIGIRIENDILISDHGPVDLMDQIPVEASDIEDIMAKEFQRP
ncbi:MAG: aminopeptidase P family protein [Bacteroidia bacterium]